MSQAKTGRYSVGQQIVGVAAVVAYPGNNKTPACKRSQVFLPSVLGATESGVKVLDFVFKLFTVKEHCRVPHEYGEENDHSCDGYILQPSENNANEQVWYNQYPVASFGQLDDTGNYIFNLRIADNTSDKEFQRIFNDWKNPWQFIEIDYFLGKISLTQQEKEKLIKDLNSENPRYSLNAVAKTQQTYLSFMQAFNRDLGDRFKIIEKEIYPGYFRKSAVAK